MSKKKKRTKNNRVSKSSGPAAAAQEAFRVAQILPALPGIILVCVTMLELFAALLLPDMQVLQYTYYQNIFRVGNGLVLTTGILWWVMYLRRKVKNDSFWKGHPERIFFGLFLLWMFLSTMVNGLDDKALYGVPYRNQSVILIAAYILIYFELSRWIGRSERGYRWQSRIYRALILTADLMAAAALVHRFWIPIGAFAGKKELSAIFFNGNHYGYFLTIVILLSAAAYIISEERRVRYAGLCSSLLNMFVLFINNSFGCILAVITSLILVAVLVLIRMPEVKWRALTVLVLYIGLPMIGSAVMMSQVENVTSFLNDVQMILGGGADAASAGTNRWGQWLTAWTFIKEQPLFGFGCEGFSERMKVVVNIANPHNEILTYALNFGVPAAVFYTLGVLSVFVEHIRRGLYRNPLALMGCSAAIGYFVSAMFGVAMFYTTPFFFLLMGYCLSDREQRN